jgi:elongation factor Ts
MAISAAQVKELRETTGAGMMDCKAALTETDGNLNAAIDWLRTKGLAKAAKKADRVAAEGLVGIAVNGPRAAMVEVNSETDFVARNDQFQQLVSRIAETALQAGKNAESLAAAPFPGTGHTVAEEVTEAIAKIGENMSLRRSTLVEVSQGAVGSYVHAATAPGLGRIGILVGLESGGDAAKLEAFGRQLAMHVAAANPLSLSPDDLDPEVVAKERSLFAEQARESGKPAEIIEKMVEGRLRKFYEEVCFLSQTFVIDGETKVSDAVEAAGKDAGALIKVTGFVRFALGEGIEKEESDFAAEVAATAGTK